MLFVATCQDQENCTKRTNSALDRIYSEKSQPAPYTTYLIVMNNKEQHNCSAKFLILKLIEKCF